MASSAMETTAVSTYTTSKGIKSLQEGLLASIKTLQAQAELDSKQAAALGRALEALKSAAGVDSLSDPGLSGLMQHAEASDGAALPEDVDVAAALLAEAEAKRQSESEARKAALDAHERELEADLLKELEALKAEKAASLAATKTLKARNRDLDMVFERVAEEQAMESDIVRERLTEIAQTNEWLETLGRLMAVLGPYNKELEHELKALETMMAVA
ncbi:hypothetical protein FNF27_02318 [Cafeteria roenbergensis]|uniref:Uncharacterized protein n=1 Tax=Cafeteria roenbergensis TaxID=33653 RepID=A0A5A8EKE0_CAFRO|nr:hypothetical protein FNF27_02318 [Cafeteria roenbergensis]